MHPHHTPPDDPASFLFWTTVYWLLSMLRVNVIENHADFRLMSRKALTALLEHQKVNLFLGCLIPTLGFAVVHIPYARKARYAGETKYTLRKMLGLALDGITSFSVLPLRIIAITGSIVFVLLMSTGLFFLTERILYPQYTVLGWASTVLPLLFFGWTSTAVSRRTGRVHRTDLS